MTPTVSICGSTSPLKVSMWQSRQQMSLRGGPSSGSCPKWYRRWRSGNSSCHASTTFWKCMPTCCHSWLTFPFVFFLAKITDPKTFDMVMKAAARLMIQVNVPEHYLSPVQHPPPKTTAEERLSWLEKVILPQPVSLAQEPQYRPTRLLAAAVWLCLKCKFFNGGTAKEACTTFEVRAKQLSKLLLGKVYLGGSTGAAKGKCKQSHTVACEGDVTGDEPPSLSPLQEVNTIVTSSSSTGGTKMGFIYDYI